VQHLMPFRKAGCIDHDLARRALMGYEQIDQQRIDLRAVAVDLAILRAIP
jgi:hypothetical protein